MPLARLASLTVEKSTSDSYYGSLERLWKPHFADRPIGTIRPSEIKALIAQEARSVSGKSVNNALIPLRGVFLAAVDDEILDRSPTLNTRNLKHQSPQPDPFWADEMEAIIADLYRHYDPQVGNWYEFAFGTGVPPRPPMRMADSGSRSTTVGSSARSGCSIWRGAVSSRSSSWLLNIAEGKGRRERCSRRSCGGPTSSG